MDLSKLLSKIPFLNRTKEVEYFFSLIINQENLQAAIWSIDSSKLNIVGSTTSKYEVGADPTGESLIKSTDLILDKVLGDLEVEPTKILFGVPDAWLFEGDLKPENLNIIRALLKELDLQPLAYVATSSALAHFLGNQESAPPTAIVVGIEKNFLTIFVLRAGKIDGVRVVKRGDEIGVDVERELLSFTNIEVLPSRILIWGSAEVDLNKERSTLLSYAWMSKLSFLHFPKIDILGDEVNIKAVCLAGAVELDSNVKFTPQVSAPVKETTTKQIEMEKEEPAESGFIVGDINEQAKETPPVVEENLGTPEDQLPPQDNLLISPPPTKNLILNKAEIFFSKFKNFKKHFIIPVALLLALILFYLFVPKAEVKIFIEPRVLERDTQVTADPAIKTVDEEGKKIPGQIVETQVSGTDKIATTGKKQVGDSAKGKVTIYNKTDAAKTFSKGTLLSSANLKFSLDNTVTIASQSAVTQSDLTTVITPGKISTSVTATTPGADSNLPSNSDLTVATFASSQFVAKADGNFSGGTSREVTVVAEADQQKLLATLASTLRKKAQEEIQDRLNKQSAGKKILEEALAEEILKRSFNKNVGDQGNELSLNLTIKYKGTAYTEDDLKLIVSKLVTTQIPTDFELNLAQTETQADVSKLEKDGKLIFLARFKAKLVPKLNLAEIKTKLRGRTPYQAAETLKAYENVLGSEIRITPSLPPPFQILPILDQNIKVEVGLK